MQKALIQYLTLYGSTEQYVRWIEESCAVDVHPIERKLLPDFDAYDTILFGSYLRIGRVAVAKYMVKHWPKLLHKRIGLFVVGAADPAHPRFRQLYEANFSPELREHINFFPLPGRLDLDQLTAGDRGLIKIAGNMETDEAVRRTLKNGVDGVRQERIDGIVAFLGGA